MQPFLVASGFIVILAAFAGAPAYAQADPADVLPAMDGLKQLIPGEEFIPAAVRAKQEDDFDNPAYPFVEAGEIAWSTPEGPGKKSCKGCHGSGDNNNIKHVAVTYPKYAPGAGKVITLEARINLCREQKMQLPPLPATSEKMIALTANLRSLSRGLSPEVQIDGPSTETFKRGAKLYHTKLGLLQLSCAECHTERFGKIYGGATLSQGHPLSYPVYITSTKQVIPLQERFRMCNRLVRAEVQQDNAPDYVALELYLNWRAKGLPITAPGVRP